MPGPFSSKYYVVGARDQYIRQKMALKFQHVPTGQRVSFPAFIEMFSDAYNSNWNAEDVYGRMDPVANFINTRRSLAVSWNVPADSYEHAATNLQKMNRLISFLYPLYDAKESDGATAINQGPLMRIEFGNLIRNAQTGGGLLGYVNGFTFDPDFEQGVFYGKNSPRDLNKAAELQERIGNPQGAAEIRKQARSIMNVDVEYLPKTFRVNFEFNVLHEHSLGFQITTSKLGQGKVFTFGKEDQNLGDMTFPYSVSTSVSTDIAADTADFLFNQEQTAAREFRRETVRLQDQYEDPGGVGAKLALSALNKK